ncbi:2Fe-2S iron-sulfur cluster-binding protein [Yeosuana sp.]|uniref:2Fe-2S iron-sulfur cluster-binding protein n=1 Tax=Yeosuana sp. TaxID=2529388 RepID=UPI004054ABEB|tara:strand:+ start:3942 stop:4262 length:321 start_codon:yes stop_codon:yes gene_type:complete
MIYKVNIITSYNELYEVDFKRYEYPNLMELIIDNGFDDIGECLGRGLCGTCHVKIMSGAMEDTLDKTEKLTLKKTYNIDTNSRLACQIMLNEKINNMTFKIITDNT